MAEMDSIGGEMGFMIKGVIIIYLLILDYKAVTVVRSQSKPPTHLIIN